MKTSTDIEKAMVDVLNFASLEQKERLHGALDAMLKYSPGQARDDHGRFATGGGGGVGGSAPDTGGGGGISGGSSPGSGKQDFVDSLVKTMPQGTKQLSSNRYKYEESVKVTGSIGTRGALAKMEKTHDDAVRSLESNGFKLKKSYQDASEQNKRKRVKEFEHPDGHTADFIRTTKTPERSSHNTEVLEITYKFK